MSGLSTPDPISAAREAERIYTQYRQHGLGGWGPFIHYEDPERQAGLDDDIDRVLGTTPLLHVDNQTLWLPSAWHAVLFFIRAERYLKYRSPPQHQLYRGHADPGWRLESTFDRVSAAERNQQWTASTLFAMYLARRLYYPMLHVGSYAAVARHLGFASKQMDWTVDPAVAVYFASQPSAGARDGRVFMLQVPDALDLGLEVFCPPPFCDRVYSQLGVFLRPSPSARLDLSARTRSVQFPKPDAGQPFRIWRDGQELDLLRSHPWLEESARWARETAARFPDAIENEADLLPLVEEAMKAITPPPNELKADSLLSNAEWGVRVLDLFHWLFIFMSRDGRATLVPADLAVPIVRQNRELTRVAAETLRIVQKAAPDIDYHKLDRCLDSLLADAGPPEPEDDDVFGVLKRHG